MTPRVFEAAIGKCYMIGKYEKNSEYYSFGLDKLVDMPNSYDEFEASVNSKLQTKFHLQNEYSSFLHANLNSTRIAQMNNDLNPQ